MKKYTKFIIIGISIIIVLILIKTLIPTKINDYKNISLIITELYKNEDYDKKGLSKKEEAAIDKYITTLTHENHIVNLNKFTDEAIKTTEPNSLNVFVEDDICYIDYNDINFTKIDPLLVSVLGDKIVCNGYEYTVYDYDFYPTYEETKEDPMHIYQYLGYEVKNNTYIYFYKSYYNKDEIAVFIETANNDIIDISVEGINIYDYNVTR